MATKICSKCSQPKSTSLFSKDPKMKSGLRSWCKACTSESSSKIQVKKYSSNSTYKEIQKDRREGQLKKCPHYVRYSSMIQRCYNPSASNYADYGGRGITICAEWMGKKGYKKWYDFVSKLPYFEEPSYTQDRIDNDGNYEPDNVRWATRKEQRANQRKL